MKIAITANNAEKIEAALRNVNGKACDHAYTTYGEIASLASQAEFALGSLSIPRALRSSSTWTETSGGKVASSYRYSRNATRVTLTRGVSGWYLTEVSATQIWASGGGKGKLTVSPAADQAAKAALATAYTVK